MGVGDVRVVAAQALDRIVRGGVSLRSGFAHFSIKLSDPRDRALLTALLHAGARWWLRYDAALDLLLARPVRDRDPQIHALLVLALVQIEILGLPEYAAVAATVDAVRTLRRPAMAGMTNAVLRRWLRERVALNARLDADAVTRCAHPRWMLDALAADWPVDVEGIIAANNAQAPLWLRVNRRRGSREALLTKFAAADIRGDVPAESIDALRLAQSTDVTRLPGYTEGEFSVQDGAAQFAATLLDARDGERVLDACAAPGGKSAHILERANVNLVALDADAQRLPRLRENLQRLGLQADVRVGDASAPSSWWDSTPFDRILLDVPCSATGIIRRQPDIKLHRRADDLVALVQIQRRMLDALWPLLRPGGRLVYATCSVLAAENSSIITEFLARQPQASMRKIVPPGWREMPGGAQNLPGQSGMDGFFYAVVEKNN